MNRLIQYNILVKNQDPHHLKCPNAFPTPWFTCPAACPAACPPTCPPTWPPTTAAPWFIAVVIAVMGWTPMRELATPAPAGAAAVPATTPTRATALTPSPTPRAALYYPLFSFKQAALHPSPSTVLPSSHSSPVSTTPLPQLI